jgi:hypothetical protein
METLCPKCRKKYVVSDSLAGKQARCKNEACRQVFTIPAKVAGAAAPSTTPKPVQAAAPKPASPAGNGQGMSSLLDDLPPLPLDNLPQSQEPGVVLSNYTPARAKRAKKWASSSALKLGGGIAAGLVVCGLLVWLISSMLSGGGGGSSAASPSSGDDPNWALYYIPENAQVVAYINFDELRRSSFYPDLQKLFNSGAMQMGEIGMDNISDIFIAGAKVSSNEEPLVVVRMRKDCALKDLQPKHLPAPQTENFKNTEYMKMRSRPGAEMLLAKMSDRTFCFAPGEDMLKQAIERVGRKERTKLDNNLQAALDSVASSNLYFATCNEKIPQTPMGGPFAVDQVSLRGSTTSSLQIEATVVFAKVEDAANCKKVIDGFLSMIAMMPSERKKEIEPLLAGLKINQDGKQLRCEVNWKNEDLVALVKKAGAGAFPFPGQPGAVPPGMMPGQPGMPPPAPFHGPGR